MRVKAMEAAAFIRSFLGERDLPVPVAVGYSNGANLAAAQLWSGTLPFRAAILMRPVAPHSAPLATALEGFPVMVVADGSDTVIDVRQTRRLVEELTHASASKRRTVLDTGHDFGPDDTHAIRDFLISVC